MRPRSPENCPKAPREAGASLRKLAWATSRADSGRRRLEPCDDSTQNRRREMGIAVGSATNGESRLISFRTSAMIYEALRLTRRHMPRAFAGAIVRTGTFGLSGPGSGKETREPAGAVDLYLRELKRAGAVPEMVTVTVLGYGGELGVAQELLKRGVKHVLLLDPFAAPKAQLPSGARVIDRLESCDAIVSWSVLEHVVDPASAIHEMANAAPFGVHVVDLRDHAFRWPFRMLRYSSAAWAWLNPPTNLNRWRLWQYCKTFEDFFVEVDIEVLERDQAAFDAERPHMKAVFISGNISEDSATQIQITVSQPRSAV